MNLFLFCSFVPSKRKTCFVPNFSKKIPHELQVWTYIKAKSLQDSEDKKQINCDAKMKALTKRTTIKSHEIFSALTENMAQKA